jgi:uncharacterized membrane protein
MEPKTTLNLSIAFFSNVIQKTILFLTVFFNKKTNTIPSKISYIIFLMLCTVVSFAQSGSCKGTLQVEDNSNYTSVPPEGTYYTMLLSNTGTTNSTYTLSSSNVNSSCSNGDGSSTSGNVNLNISFTDANSNPISEITLNPGETATFLALIKVPLGTTVSKWNCTQISASATTCSNYSLNTILHTLVSDPNQE